VLRSTAHSPYQTPQPSAFNGGGVSELVVFWHNPPLMWHILINSDPHHAKPFTTYPPLRYKLLTSFPYYRPLPLTPVLHSLISLPITSPFSLCHLSPSDICLPLSIPSSIITVYLWLAPPLCLHMSSLFSTSPL
jgi:hypothetical protein